MNPDYPKGEFAYTISGIRCESTFNPRFVNAKVNLNNILCYDETEDSKLTPVCNPLNCPLRMICFAKLGESIAKFDFSKSDIAFISKLDSSHIIGNCGIRAASLNTLVNKTINCSIPDTRDFIDHGHLPR